MEWDLPDLVSPSDIARELQVSRPTVSTWASRYSSFPEPLTVVGCGHTKLYSRREVMAWRKAITGN